MNIKDVDVTTIITIDMPKQQWKDIMLIAAMAHMNSDNDVEVERIYANLYEFNKRLEMSIMKNLEDSIL